MAAKEAPETLIHADVIISSLNDQIRTLHDEIHFLKTEIAKLKAVIKWHEDHHLRDSEKST